MDRGKLYLHDQVAGQIEIKIAGNQGLCRMQDLLKNKTGVLIKDILLSEFYDRFDKEFPSEEVDHGTT